MRLGIAAILMAAAAFCIQLSATSNWGSAAADGSRYKVSPVGLHHALAVTSNATDGEACRWWPAGAGNAQLCAIAPNGHTAFVQLRAAYPLFSVALWTAVVSLFLQVLRLPRALGARAGLAWFVSLLVAAAAVCLTLNAPRALVVLTGRPMTYGALGFWMGLAAIAFSGASGALQVGRRR